MIGANSEYCYHILNLHHKKSLHIFMHTIYINQTKYILYTYKFSWDETLIGNFCESEVILGNFKPVQI